MHKVHTGRLLPRKFQMLTRYIKEAITKGGKCYLSALFFLWRERERERESQIQVGICYHQRVFPTVANTHWVFSTVANTHH